MTTGAEGRSESQRIRRVGCAQATQKRSLLISDPGLFDTFKEAGAAAKHYAEARRNNTSKLVRELSADPGMGFGIGKSPQQLETETLSALRAAAATPVSARLIRPAGRRDLSGASGDRHFK